MIFVVSSHERISGYRGLPQTARRRAAAGPPSYRPPRGRAGRGGRAAMGYSGLPAWRPGPGRRDNPREAAAMPRPDDPPVAKPPFPELPAVVDLPAIEREVLARWRDGRVFERSLEQTAAGKPWTFYEGPPTANGKPGVHHVEARVLKDLFPRFKTMQGFHVPRQGGWDCHGLPVEVAVEQELGLSGKKEIEAYGIAEFNARCRESVLRHVDAFE